MKLSDVFQRFILEEIKKMDETKTTGRPKTLQNEDALNCMFRILRTGMQWREIDSNVSYATVFRRVQK